MSEDIEMDAPQISTLRDEESPEPPPKPSGPASTKLRVKLLLKETKRPSSIASKASNPTNANDTDEDEDEDEEDQLIDDDEDEKPTPPPPVTTTSSGRSSIGKRGTPRTRGGAGGKRRNVKTDASQKTTTPLVEGWTPDGPSGSAAQVSQPTTKKRAAPKAGGAQRAAKKRAPKGAKAIPPTLRDDAGSISEAYAPTAASSPLPHDEHSPEPEHPPVSVPVAPPSDEMKLEGVALPVYPLPSKPFPVQPPPKIGSGFAPVIPLDRNGRVVRKWRQANREVRGIAGGRWFAKTWIGEKESEFATAAATAAAAAHAAAAQAAVESAAAALSGMSGMNLPKLSIAGLSGIGSGKATPRLKALKTDSGLATGPSSRAGSAGAESISVQLPSRKRTGVPAASGAESPAVSTPAP